MPRNPAAKKNQHNNRHENGLVGPGKRVSKQKSNGHLNGNVKPALPDEPVPTAAHPDAHSNVYSSAVQGTSSRSDAPPALRKRASESSTDGYEQKWEGVNGSANDSQKRPSMGSSKSRSTQDLNAVHIATTILKSCPAGDTVALLIVLLALPSLVLTIVQALFASLTLVPPGNVSPVSFLSLFDVFQGSAGSPSLGTMAVVDIICLGLWIGLWNWAQNFALDLAQIQIAITLGNGNSGKNGSVNIFCFVIVLLLHSVRSGGVRRFFISNLVPGPVLSNPWFAEIARYLPAESDFGEGPSPPSKVRSLFAIHILSQAFMAFVRRRVTSSQSRSPVKSSKRMDTEAFAGTSSTLEPLNIDAANSASATGVDYQSPPTPNFKDSKDKTISAKKRRRQANQFRSRQPFWAALASTKVHVLRDFENGQGHRAGAHENQVFGQSSQQGVIWVNNVEPSKIRFDAVCSKDTDHDQEYALTTDGKPFFVRINGAKWHSVRLELAEGQGPFDRWSGTISGLAPDCTYTCTFNRADGESEFASVMVKTPAIQDGDMTASQAVTQPRGSLRPSSPTTTLKNSIQNADARLNEAKQRLHRTKKTHKAAIQRVDKDVETLTQRLKSGGDENKQRQKLLQAERNTQQNRDDIIAIEAELDNFEAIPENEVVDYGEKRAAHDEQNKVLNAAQAALDDAKNEAKNKVAEVNNELTALTSRKDRLKRRQDQLTEQYNRITEANVRGMNERERKAAESAAIEAERQRHENEMKHTINVMFNELRDVQSRIHRSNDELVALDALEKQSYAQRELMLNNGPLTPEGTLPGTNPPQPRTFMFGGLPPSSLATSTLASETQSSPFLAYANTLPGSMRPRSNTNRSIGAISGFSADFEDADPIPPMPMSNVFDGNGSTDRKSSGSSRSKNNGSPAGVIGDGLRSPARVLSSSPGLHSAGTW